MGYAHGIYNPTDKPVQWLNINVGLSKIYEEGMHVRGLDDRHIQPENHDWQNISSAQTT